MKGFKKLVFQRQGRIFQPDGLIEGLHSHAQVPFAMPIEGNRYRIYFAGRDEKGRSHVHSMEYDLGEQKVLDVSKTPALSPGRLGTFDDSGTMPSWFVEHEGKIYMYYTAWNLGGTVSYELSISLACSTDGGNTFERIQEAPILDRGPFDTCWVGQPCVMKEGDVWRMWYLSCTKWEMINGHPEPFYHVKYAESENGIDWERKGIVCVDYDAFTDAIGRPAVVKTGGGYLMFYSYRNAADYRTSAERSYRMGMACSEDGITFHRIDDHIELEGAPGDWESIMQEYAHVVQHQDRLLLFYNGNGFGKTGFGYSECVLDKQLMSSQPESTSSDPVHAVQPQNDMIAVSHPQARQKAIEENTPDISVTVGCFNFGEYIAECLDSLLNQTLVPAKIIVGDDHSTDNSWEIISSYAAKYPQIIEAYRYPERRGHTHNGINLKNKVKTLLYSEIDGDDRWHPEKLATEWAALRNNPDCDIAYSGVRIVNEKGDLVRTWLQENTVSSHDLLVPVFAKRFYRGTRSTFRNPLMYFDCFKKIGYTESDKRIVHTDWDRTIRLAAQYKIIGTGKYMVDYRTHGGGISSLRRQGLYESLRLIMERNFHLLKDYSLPEKVYVVQNLNVLLKKLAMWSGVQPEYVSVELLEGRPMKTLEMSEEV